MRLKSYIIFGVKLPLLFVLAGLFAGSADAGLFPRKAGKDLAHFDRESPAVGQLAPDFAIKNLDGKTVRLKDLVGKKPILLKLGSHTCPVYRFRRWNMAALYRKYGGRVHFLLVYTIEAHPKGSKSPYKDREWRTWWNVVGGIKVTQAKTFVDRFNQANISAATLKVAYPMAVDGMANKTWRSYGRAASPTFVIDRRGRIALKQPWVNPREISKVLDRLLANNGQKGRK